MPNSARSVVEAAARDLLRAIAELGEPAALRVFEADETVACLIVIGDAREMMPTLKGVRVECKRDILEAIRRAGEPLTRKQLVKELRKLHGPGTVAKALADLTAAGELVNRKDNRGYRLPEWKRPETPSLFE